MKHFRKLASPLGIYAIDSYIMHIRAALSYWDRYTPRYDVPSRKSLGFRL